MFSTSVAVLWRYLVTGSPIIVEIFVLIGCIVILIDSEYIEVTSDERI